MIFPPENAQWQGISAGSLRAEEMNEHEKRSSKEALNTESQAYKKTDNT